MTAAERARRLVGEHLLSPGDAIESIREDPDGIVVESHQWQWRVSRASVSVSDWEFYDVALDVFADPPMAPHGFAIDADGRVLRLDDRSGLAEFWRLTGPAIAPREMATILTRYHGGAAHLLDDVADLDRVVGREAAAGVDDLVAPVTGTGGEFTFCTWHVDADGTVTVDRWNVHMPDWDQRTLASHLPWQVGS